MESFVKSLERNLEIRLQEIEPHKNDVLRYHEKAIQIHIGILEKLKSFFLQYRFASHAGEIAFFRHTKPSIAARLIYHNEIYKLEANKPFASTKTLRKYYLAALVRLKRYTDENFDFYKYLKTGSHLLDKEYFVRGKKNIRLTLDSFYLQADRSFSTSHDYKVAKFIANDLIRTYVEEKLEQCAHTKIPARVAASGSLRWTASKVALTELVYALHTEGTFNDGKADLKQIATFFESAFGTPLGQYNRTFLEIRERKSERAKFLNQLSEKLLMRMDLADEGK